MSLVSLLSLLVAMVPGGQVQAAQGAAAPQAQEDKHQKEIENDVKLGKEVAEQAKKELPASDNQEYIDKINRIGKELSEIANKTVVKVTWGDNRLSPFTYEFHVLKGDDVNAFSLPGGIIYVYEGCIKFAETDDELAGVLAHEISHAAFRHIATLRREQSKFDVVNIPLILAAIFSKSPDAGNILVGADLLNRAVGSGWSVKAEQAADYGGLQYMLASKYNPVGMLTFMERLAFKDRGAPNVNYSILQTHPPSAERAKALMQRLQEYNVQVRRSQVTKSWRAEVLPGENSSVELWFGKTKVYTFGGSEALTRADNAAEALDTFFDSVPAIYELGVKEGNRIIGQERLLIDVAPDDGPEPEKRLEVALSALKKLVFDINYRLWQNHDRAAIDR